MNLSKRIRVIRVKISTRTMRNMVSKVGSHWPAYKTPELREAYLDGIRDVLRGCGPDEAYSFMKAVERGDVRHAARFCSDGWRELGGSPDDYRLRPDLTGALVELKRLCDKALRAAEDAGEGPQPGSRAPSAPVDLNDECL